MNHPVFIKTYSIIPYFKFQFFMLLFNSNPDIVRLGILHCIIYSFFENEIKIFSLCHFQVQLQYLVGIIKMKPDLLSSQ